jgi:type I site-specific restriction endonuclease
MQGLCYPWAKELWQQQLLRAVDDLMMKEFRSIPQKDEIAKKDLSCRHLARGAKQYTANRIESIESIDRMNRMNLRSLEDHVTTKEKGGGEGRHN